MRRRPLALALAVALIGVLSACSTGVPTAALPAPAPSGDGDAEQATQSGPVQVKVRLDELSGQQARFTVTLDNHEQDLTADLADTASLVIAGQPWPAGTWQVGESTGHHLSGTLTFTAPPSANPAGTAALTVGSSPGGLPSPVTLTWQQ